ncbi:MAG: hypothetical protein ACE5ID_04545 [Acidobacteriota bacterium]
MSLVGGLAVLSLVLFYQTASEALAPSVRPVVRLALSSTQLDFGEVVVHHKVIRHLVLRNEGDVGVQVRLEVDGEAFDISPASVYLDPAQRIQIRITAAPAAPGNLRNQLQIVPDTERQKAMVVTLAGSARRLASSATSRQDAAEVVARVSREDTGSPHGSLLGSRTSPRLVDDAGAEPRGRWAVGAEPPVQAVLVVAGAAAGQAPAGSPAGDLKAGSRKTAHKQKDGSPGAQDQDPSGPVPRQVSSLSLGRITLGELDNSRPALEMVQPVAPIPREITPEEEAEAHPLTGERGRRDLPDTLPDDLQGDDDPLNRDPIVSPTLTISALSRLTLLGSTAHFYPHQVAVNGTNLGGPTSLMQPIQFPLVPLGMGESVLFNQTGIAAGTFDAGTGQVTLNLPLQVVDSEGDAAPLEMQVTTGTVFARNESGLVVSLTGAPRQPGSGLVHLVGIGKIPPGYGNSAENQPVYLEILATMTFGTSIQTSSVKDYLPNPARGVF